MYMNAALYMNAPVPTVHLESIKAGSYSHWRKESDVIHHCQWSVTAEKSALYDTVNPSQNNRSIARAASALQQTIGFQTASLPDLYLPIGEDLTCDLQKPS